MKLKGFVDYRQPQLERRPSGAPPTASVVHRKNGRTVVAHSAVETCDLCLASAKRAEQAPPRLSTDNSRSGWTDYQMPPRSEQRFTAWSNRVFRAKSIEDALSMPNDFHEEREKR